VVPKIEKTSELVDNIALSGTQQLGGIVQINNAMGQLNNVTQQNVNNSEQLATSAEELSAQAILLSDSISYFKTVNKTIFVKPENNLLFDKPPKNSVHTQKEIAESVVKTKNENKKDISKEIIPENKQFNKDNKGFKLDLDDADDSEFERF
ncbi:MAG: hypothetical protein L3J74_17390, partial [Bacteroidales bacterium]|nr:hypothetical protein [Bacteroidales bacterium]